MAIASGSHHVTFIVADLELSKHFYIDVLGLKHVVCGTTETSASELRLTCATPNNDVAANVTLFHLAEAGPAVRGTGQVSHVVFSIADGTENLWERKLAQKGVKLDGYGWTFGEKILCLSDPDGLPIGLTEEQHFYPEAIHLEPTSTLAVSGIRSIEVHVKEATAAIGFLTEVLGLVEVEREGPVTRFRHESSDQRFAVDVLCSPGHRMGVNGNGIVGSIAWTVKDLAALEILRERTARAGYVPGPVADGNNPAAFFFHGPENIRFTISVEPESANIIWGTRQ